jgi:nicotinate-nucleotide pyrophosphorylase (carboxylating)
MRRPSTGLRFFFVQNGFCYRIRVDWNSSEIRRLIELALAEDHGRDDVTTQALIGKSWRVVAEIRSKQHGVVAGLPLAKLFFQRFDSRAQVSLLIQDGRPVRPGEGLLRVKSSARAVLSAERPALNALQHLSGVASYTNAQVAKLGRTRTQLFDTRKTIPGWRTLEKYAVKCGGAQNHRLHLADAVLVKENHIELCRAVGRDWVRDIQTLRRRRPNFPVQIEIQTDRDLSDAIAARPQRVLLDNMPPRTLKRMIARLRKELPGIEIEISGGVRSEDLPYIRRLGVERVSMGKLTHSAPAFDCSLDFVRVTPN